MITAVEGVKVGHWTNSAGRTGATVVILPEGTVASGEVRGGAPATREFALLDPLRTVENIDAVVLSGGSAFGLATAQGVVEYLEEQGRGYQTVAGKVPIVVGMSIFDLSVGDAHARPDEKAGRQAAEAAVSGQVRLGLVGAGTGATTSKWKGPDHVVDGGLVGAVQGHGDLVVAALIVVNALGQVDSGATPGVAAEELVAAGWLSSPHGTNTTIGLVVTNAKLSKLHCHLAAQAAHHGLARAILPSHTRFDGDAMVVAATGHVETSIDVVAALTTTVVAEAVRSLAKR